ncbi:hypothetical protein TRICI_006201 [Trichomonascus ciferrii]|uniref:PH domain-containing protein n=1 Tax=Trichomonascus ciferrii TaxID=44093 RepID=A0A642UK44_9ASCO|nr:hypothetical protein TRICI_006201 [Trichomonascus ciferrii]
MRSFWSDLEKSDSSKSIPPSPSRSPQVKSPSFQNNIFIQSDKASPSSSPGSPGKLSNKSVESSPAGQWSPPKLHGKSPSLGAPSEGPASSPKPTYSGSLKFEDLGRKSSLSRNGSASRLHGPRQIGADLSTSPSKLKKMVTFDNSAQVIQYESITPELSSSPSLESRTSEEDFEDDVPVIEPTPFNRGSVPTGRPLPQIPQGVGAPDDEEDEEEFDEDDSFIKTEPHGAESGSEGDESEAEKEEETYAPVPHHRSISPSLVRKDSLNTFDKPTPQIDTNASIAPTNTQDEDDNTPTDTPNNTDNGEVERAGKDDEENDWRETTTGDDSAPHVFSPTDDRSTTPTVFSPTDDRSTTPTGVGEPNLHTTDESSFVKPEPVSEDRVSTRLELPELEAYSSFIDNADWGNYGYSSDTSEQRENGSRFADVSDFEQPHPRELPQAVLENNFSQRQSEENSHQAYDDDDNQLDESPDQFQDAEEPSTISHPPVLSPPVHSEDVSQREVSSTRSPSPPAPQIKREESSFKDYLQLQPGLADTPRIKQEQDDTDTSPVPSLDRTGNSPNSCDSPIKTEKPSPEGRQTDSWPTVYNTNEGGSHFSLPSVGSDFNSGFSSMFEKSREASTGSLDYHSSRHDVHDVVQGADIHGQEKSIGDDVMDQKGGQEEDEYEEEEDEDEEEEEDANQEPPAVLTEPRTIRASSGRLRTRPSLTPMDVQRIGRSRSVSSNKSGTNSDEGAEDGHISKELSKKPVPMLQLSQDSISEETDSIFGNLDEEFDKMLTVKKRGYTLRENASVVVAKERRVSSGSSTGGPSKRKVSGPVKRVDMLGKVEEKGMAMETTPEHAEPDLPNTDKGRLFIRVVSIKDIDLPSVEDRNARFNLTLDNGIHCITTQNKPLHRTSFLDQEFELTVGDELEFILTLKAKYTKKNEVVSNPIDNKPTIPPPSTTSKGETRARHGLSRIFGSPKKRIGSSSSTASSKLQQSPQIKEQPIVKRDPWESIIATDGSFGRSYVAFSQYKDEIYGRPATFEVPCYNEWGKTGKSKRPPYKIGKLQVQMMFVPRGNKKETLPQSIKEALEELRNSRKQEPVEKEGFLSQLGGDCKYWRRRYFKLDGTTLTAYSETSRKPRATINLAKALRVIYEKNQLTQPVVMVGKNRRKSAFAQEEEAFMFVNEAFRIRFGNGEIIDFYADGEEVKREWIENLTKVIGSATERKPWVDLVKRHETSSQ